MHPPTVTVLMPAYNAQAYIAEAIESVLAQTYAGFELLIIDDGSTDNTANVIQRYSDPRIRLETNPKNLRLIKTLNRGIDLARGKYIARLDADDRALPQRLAKQVAALETNPNLAIVGGQVTTLKQTPKGCKRLRTRQPHPIDPQSVRMFLLVGNPFCHSAVTFRTETVRALGGYPSWAVDIEDFALWSQLLQSYDGANLPDTVCEYRVHSESILRRAHAQSKKEGWDPRISLSQQIYEANALLLSGNQTFAQRWASLWPKITYIHADHCEWAQAKLLMKQVTSPSPRHQSHLMQSRMIEKRIAMYRKQGRYIPALFYYLYAAMGFH